MANYCFTNYCIEGNKSSLSKIANAINLTDGCVDNISMRYNVCINDGEGDYAYADLDTEQDVVKFCIRHNIEVPQDIETIEQLKNFCSNNDIEFSCCDIMLRDDHGVITDEVMQQIHVSVEKQIQ